MLSKVGRKYKLIMGGVIEGGSKRGGLLNCLIKLLQWSVTCMCLKVYCFFLGGAENTSYIICLRAPIISLANEQFL